MKLISDAHSLKYTKCDISLNLGHTGYPQDHLTVRKNIRFRYVVANLLFLGSSLKLADGSCRTREIYNKFL